MHGRILRAHGQDKQHDGNARRSRKPGGGGGPKQARFQRQRSHACPGAARPFAQDDTGEERRDDPGRMPRFRTQPQTGRHRQLCRVAAHERGKQPMQPHIAAGIDPTGQHRKRRGE